MPATMEWQGKKFDLPDGEYRLREEVPAARVTTTGTGGPIKLLVEVARRKDLVGVAQALIQQAIPFVLLGQGSNVLVSDSGFDGVVLRCWGRPAEVMREEGLLEASATAPLDELVRCAAELGLAGLEFASGIPGTVGGAVWGNAGAFGGEIGECVEAVEVVTQEGAVEWWGADKLALTYRESVFCRQPAVITAVRLKLHPGSRESLLRRRDELLAERERRFPDWRKQGTCGSFFRNPPGLHAAAMIEDCGLKGEQVGGVMVSPQHAGFLVRVERGAGSTDFVRLALRVAETVEKRFGIGLIPEVRFLGDFGDLLPPQWRSWCRVPCL